MVYLVIDQPAADWVALAVFAVASATDLLDGWIARRFNLETRLGAAMDSVADKALVMVALAVLVGSSEIQNWLLLPVAMIVVRELLVAGLREVLDAKDKGLASTGLGKWKAAVQMLAICILFAGNALGTAHPVQLAGVCLLWLGALMTIISGVDYARRAFERIEN